MLQGRDHAVQQCAAAAGGGGGSGGREHLQREAPLVGRVGVCRHDLALDARQHRRAAYLDQRRAVCGVHHAQADAGGAGQCQRASVGTHRLLDELGKVLVRVEALKRLCLQLGHGGCRYGAPVHWKSI